MHFRSRSIVSVLIWFAVAGCTDDGASGDGSEDAGPAGGAEPEPGVGIEPEPGVAGEPEPGPIADEPEPTPADDDVEPPSSPETDAATPTHADEDGGAVSVFDGGVEPLEPDAGDDTDAGSPPVVEVDGGEPMVDAAAPSDPCTGSVTALCGPFAVACEVDGQDYSCTCDAAHSVDADGKGCHERGWTEPTQFTPGRSSSPSLAYDAEGVALVTYLRYDGTRDQVVASEWTHSGGFGQPMALETTEAPTTGWPAIAMNANGDAMVTYHQWQGTGDRIYAVPYTHAGGFGAAVLIDEATAGSSQFPRVSLDAAGNALIVWQHTEAARTDIMAARYTVAGGFSTPVLIEMDDSGSAHAPRVALDESGSGFAVWDQSDGTNDRVHVARYDSEAGWAAPTALSDTAQGAARNAIIAGDGQGTFIVAWEQTLLGANANVLARRYASGSWGLSNLLNSSTAGNARNGHVAVSAAGPAVVTWAQSDGTGDRIYVNRWAGSWQGQTRIDTGAGASAPHVSLDAQGNALAVWGQTVSSEHGVWASRFGTAWTTPVSLEEITGTAYGPAAGLLANGEAVVVFEVFQSSESDHVYGVSFD